MGAYLGHVHRDLGSGGRGASRAERSRPRDDWGAAVEKLYEFRLSDFVCICGQQISGLNSLLRELW